MLNKICPNCNKEFTKKKNESLRYWNTKKYCSPNCANLSKRGIRANPKGEFKIGNKNQLGKKNFLGKCHTIEMRTNMSKNRMGDKNPNYKGGSTLFKANKTIEWKLWRDAVFTRDNYLCIKCREHSRELRPHHIKNFSQYPEIRFAIDNGITFCNKCHKLFHKTYGVRNNNSEQIKEFLL